jgi:hypothetical protein
LYDLIGDIHGHADELEELLEKLGYRHSGDYYRHASRTVIFLGDFIDRGPHQKRVLELVRPMIDGGAARAVMGNHEFNAIAYFTPDGKGGHLRPRSCKNKLQHLAFLEEFKNQTLLEDYIDWFKTLPLWLELDGLRVVHACWDQPVIEKITEEYGGGALLTEDLLRRSSDRDKKPWEYRAVETLLKGKEMKLPEDASFRDKDDNLRREIRVKWWEPAKTYKDAFFGPESARTYIPDYPIQGDHMIEYGRHEKPVFLGHYWLDGDPFPLTENIACLDYGVAKPRGKLVAYSWNGEQKIDQSKYVVSERIT